MQRISGYVIMKNNNIIIHYRTKKKKISPTRLWPTVESETQTSKTKPHELNSTLKYICIKIEFIDLPWLKTIYAWSDIHLFIDAGRQLKICYKRLFFFY